MSTETEALGQWIIPENSLQPDVVVNKNAEATSKAMVGIVTLDLIADADHVLLPTEYVCNVLVITDSGTVLTGPVDIEYPALFPRQTVTNNTAETLTLRMDGTTGITLAAGDTTTIVAGLADVIETGGGGGISDAPSDGTTYGRKNGAWAGVAGGGGGGGMSVLSVYLAASVSSPSSAEGKVPLDTVEVDTDSIWDAVNTRAIPTTAGYYSVNVRVATASAGGISTRVLKNGSVHKAIGGDSSSTYAGGASAIVYCNGTTDYIEAGVYTSTSRSYTNNASETWMQVVGPM